MSHRNGKTPQPSATSMQSPATSVQPSATSMQSSATSVQPSATSMQPSVGKSRPNLGGFVSTDSIDTRLVAAQVAIDSVLGDAQLQARMAAHGYTATRMREGRALRDRALALHQQQRTAYAAQLTATDARTTMQRQAQATYKRHVALARVALRDNRSAARALDLDAPRKRTRAGWLIQAQHFYTNLRANPSLVGSMAEYGVTHEQLGYVQREIALIEAALVAQQTTKEAAQAATRTRNVALSALNRWMRDFLAVSRVALADLP
jgi:hypothetical protein